MTDHDGRDDLFHKIDDATKLDGPHGWIQWKGTGVCCDIHCTCGERTHLDAEFAYYVRCGACGAVYAMGQYIKLVPMTEEDRKEIDAAVLKESS